MDGPPERRPQPEPGGEAEQLQVGDSFRRAAGRLLCPNRAAASGGSATAVSVSIPSKRFIFISAANRTTMAQAGGSDLTVVARLNDSEAAFNSLGPEAAAAQMPRLQAPMVSLGRARVCMACVVGLSVIGAMLCICHVCVCTCGPETHPVFSG
jgi:hypothetical protein